MKNNPLVSILIVTHNSAEYIEACLNSIAKVTYKPIELIVVDNNSTDATNSLVKNNIQALSFETNHIRQKNNRGYAEGNNIAAKHADGKYFFILNPDSVVSPHFLQPLVKKAETDSRISAVQPAVYLSITPQKLNLTGKETHFLGFDWIRDFEQKNKRRSGYLHSWSGSGVLLRKNIFDELNGFDDKYFMYYEDTDLSWRMRLVGHKLWFETNSIIYHDYKYTPHESYQPLKRKLFYIERNRLLTIFKNYSFKTLLLIFPMLVLIELLMVIFAVIQGWGLVKIRSYVELWKLRHHIVGQRKEIQTTRNISDKRIVEVFLPKLMFKEFQHPVVRYALNPMMYLYWQIIKPII
jgi:GT2 family glycosyltransferase